MSAEQKPIDIYLIRHAETIDNQHRLVSGGDSDPSILPEGLNKAKKSAVIYRALLTDGSITESTPIITSAQTRARETATAMTGRTDFIVNEALNERNFGKWVSVLTERLYKEFRAIKDLGKANTKDLDIGETIPEHKSRVEGALKEIIDQAKISGPQVIFSHSGTMRRISEILIGNGNIKVEGTVPYHARSLDGGKSWKIKRLSLENGKINEQSLESKEKPGETPKAKLGDILKEHQNNISITPYADQLILKVTGLKLQNVKPLASDLGKLLIGEHYNEHNDSPPRVKQGNDSASISLSRAQFDILEKFAQLQGIDIPVSSEISFRTYAKSHR
jgi:broad specificity phosphatase PhoE